MPRSGSLPRIVPAQLSFLAIYNPVLGNTDETLKEQIVYYFGAKRPRNLKRRNDDKQGPTVANHDSHGDQSGDEKGEEENERLRQVGLAQGMVDFAK